MRPEESAYWESMCQKTRPNGGYRDNIWKRQVIVRKLLELDLIGKTILEIGIGMGVSFAAINLAILGKFKYIGTDLSEGYCSFVKDHWNMDVRQTDVTCLPARDNSIDIVVALDSLEHIHPDDREAGNKEINRVLSHPGQLVIHLGLEPSFHDNRFDHPYGSKEVLELLDTCGMRMVRHDVYTVDVGGKDRDHLWVIGERP